MCGVIRQPCSFEVWGQQVKSSHLQAKLLMKKPWFHPDSFTEASYIAQSSKIQAPVPPAFHLHVLDFAFPPRTLSFHLITKTCSHYLWSAAYSTNYYGYIVIHFQQFYLIYNIYSPWQSTSVVSYLSHKISWSTSVLQVAEKMEMAQV